MKILEEKGQLKRISALVDPDLEIAEISNRMLQKGGPGLLFENVKGSPFAVAVNLMGHSGKDMLGNEYAASPRIGGFGEKVSDVATTKAAKEDFPSDRLW